jgi:hypothetical protein
MSINLLHPDDIYKIKYIISFFLFSEANNVPFPCRKVEQYMLEYSLEMWQNVNRRNVGATLIMEMKPKSSVYALCLS